MFASMAIRRASRVSWMTVRALSWKPLIGVPSRKPTLPTVAIRWLSTNRPTDIVTDVESQTIAKKVSQSDLQIVVNAKLARAANVSALLDALIQAEDSGWKSNYLTYSAAIERAVRLRDMSGAEDLLRRMSERGLKCDTALYNVLLDGYAQSGDTVKMSALRRRMVADSAVHDLSSYAALIYGHARANEDEVARELLREIVAVGLPKRTTGPWNALMAGHAAGHRVREIEHAFDDMVASGIVPDPDSYTIRVRVYIQTKVYKRALEMLVAMWDGDVPRPSHLYIELIEAMQLNPRDTDPPTLLKVLQLVNKERSAGAASTTSGKQQ
jgi:pentatricopeptide repeat protein